MDVPFPCLGKVTEISGGRDNRIKTMNNVKQIEVKQKEESKAAQNLANAIIYRETSTADRAMRAGILKGTEKYDELKKQFKRAGNLISSYAPKDMLMNEAKAGVSINYHSLAKCKLKLSGGIQEDSTFEKAVNIIRKTRCAAFLASLNDLTPSYMSGMPDDVWEKVALQTGWVPAKYRKETENGNHVINRESAQDFRLAHNLECREKAQAEDKEAVEAETVEAVA